VKYPARTPSRLWLVRVPAIATLAWAAVDLAMVLTGHPLTRGGQVAWLIVAIALSAWILWTTLD
jgi:hypothetical protein